ncbi:hypothetical protein E2C01_068314 [Portunus trituberculatus]|uniref:Uncharacterized protein n=1 Tax=Portunus trituberculatus TaxID=210409 RepID=A0A5B7HM30_PORTR|nr:hypothetical protein [Portunus trituberculatus]
MSDTITSEQRTTLRQQAQERIKQDLIPSFKEIRNFIVDQYLLATRTEVGVSSLPGGKPYYQACLKFHTTTDLTPQEIHDMGQKEVARIEKEVHKAWRNELLWLAAPIRIHSGKGRGSEVHKLEFSGETAVVKDQPVKPREKQQEAQTRSFPGETEI